MSDFRYGVEVRWSEADGHFLAVVPELPGCVSDGETQEEALRNVIEIAKQWIETAQEIGREVPEPMTGERFVRAQADFIRHIVARAHEQVQPLVENAVEKMMKQLEASEEAQGILLGQERARFFHTAVASPA